MTYPQLRTPHGLLVAVHNGTTLAYLARLNRLAAAARTVADEWCLFDTSEDFLRLTPAVSTAEKTLLTEDAHRWASECAAASHPRWESDSCWCGDPSALPRREVHRASVVDVLLGMGRQP